MRVFPRPLTLAATALATVSALVQVPVFADSTAPQVVSISISPGGPGYTLSGQPSYTAQVPGSTSATFTLIDGTDTVWSGSATTVSNVATVTPPPGLLEPGAHYSIDVVANQGDLVSSELDSSFQVDTGAAVSAPATCSSPCTPYSPEQPLSDLTFGAAQTTDVSLDSLPGNPTEIGTIRLRITIGPIYPAGSSTGSLTGSVRIFDPSAPAPVAPTLSHLWNGHDKKSFTSTVDVPVSSVNAVQVLGEGAGPGTVHVVISAIGWLPWETADEAAQDDANDDAPDPSQSDIDAAIAGQDPTEGPGATLDPTDEAALEAGDPDLATAQQDDADCPAVDTGATFCGSSGSTPQTAASTASFSTLRTAALAAPALCSQSVAAPVPTWRYTRFHACRESSIVLTRTVDKEVVAQATIEVTTKFSLATLSQDFTITRQFTLLEASGDLAAGFGMQTTFVCTRCSQGQIPEKNMYFTEVAPTTTQSWNVSGVAYLGQALTLPAAFTDRWGEVPTGLRTTLPHVRCDRLAYLPGAAGGCVVADYTPTLSQSLTGVTSDMRIPTPRIVQHIQRAQAKVPHYGEPVVGIPLTRMHNRLQRKANRRAAVSKCNRMGLAPSCDEYPYASTYQGCALVTFCSVDSVPLSENSSQGGDLSRFYGIERLADRDAFTVTVVTVVP